MVIVYFLYGLAFFMLGFSLAIFPRKGSFLPLARSLWYVAAFGILHGLHEWFQMFEMLEGSAPYPARAILSTLLAQGSFLFLLMFGSRTLYERKWKRKGVLLLPAGLLAAAICVVALGRGGLPASSIPTRYLLGAPGIFLTAYALYLHLPDVKALNTVWAEFNLKLSIGAFMFYGFFAGLVGPKAGFFPANVLNYESFVKLSGVPIQVLRTICAVMAAYGLTRLMYIFQWEVQARLSRQSVLEESHRRLVTVLDSLDAVVFAAALDTHELLFLNKQARDLFGDGTGHPCYKVLQQGRSCPCEFCTNDKLLDADGQPAGVYKWEFKNTKTGRWYALFDRAVPWMDGRIVRLEVAMDITERKTAEKEREQVIVHLEAALAEVKRLSGMLPICSCCKKIRDDKGYWHQIENYMQRHSEAQFSHGLCPDCSQKYYPDYQ